MSVTVISFRQKISLHVRTTFSSVRRYGLNTLAAPIAEEAIVPREISRADRVERDIEGGFRRVILVVVLKSKIFPTELRRESTETGRLGEEPFSEGDGEGVGIPSVSTTFEGSSFHSPAEGDEET